LPNLQLRFIHLRRAKWPDTYYVIDPSGLMALDLKFRWLKTGASFTPLACLRAKSWEGRPQMKGPNNYKAG